MANFVAVWDPVPDRREGFLRRVLPDLALVPDLRRGRMEVGPVSIAWAAGREAPLSRVRREDPDEGAVVWGDALRRSGDRVEAAGLLGSRRLPEDGEAACFDGFHGWIGVSVERGVRAGTDPLGLFPAYWAVPGRDVLVVASVPGIVGRHPAVDADLDPRGLAGVLLTNGLVEGRTLLEGVRRLGPGRVLSWTPDRGPEELPAYEPEPHPRSGGRTWRELVREADAVLEDAARRHLGGRSAATLLSGGLDSRMLTGYACRVTETGPAVTLGEPGDLDVRCAGRVARSLGMDSVRVAQRPEEIVAGARIEAADKLLSDGMSGAQGWTLALRGLDLPPVLLTGLLGDAVVAASHVDWGRSGSVDPDLSGAEFVRSVNRWGVPVGTLRRLSRPWFRAQGVEPLLDDLEGRLLPPAPSLAHRLWLSDLSHRQRYHVGSQMWRLSFASWPVAPVVDRAVLDTMAAVPVAVLQDRRLQLHLLRNQFPDLARLPLDRNSWNTLPPEPRTRDYVRHAVERRVRQSRLGRWWRRRRPESRYYYRVYDLDSSGWRTVRRAAEPGRTGLDGIFDMDLVTERYLPSPDRPLRVEDAIVDGGGRKLILGLMLASDRSARGVGAVPPGSDADA